MSGSALSDLSGLVSLAQQRELDLRPVILRVQTDLFVSAPARDRTAIEAFEALACGLLPAVDDETAAIIAAKLAPVADTPESVLHELARRGGEPLRAVLEGATQLSGPLLEIAATLGADIEAAMAARSALTQRMIEDLVALGRGPVDLALARNTSLELRGEALRILVDRARRDAGLAKPLLERDEIRSADAAALYVHADEARRRQLLAEVEALAALRKPSLPQPDPSQRAALVAHAGASDAAAFGRELAALLTLPSTPDWRFDDVRRHDLLALALRAAGVPEEESIRILLTLEPSIALAVDTVLRLVRLFRSTPRESAAYILEAVIAAPLGARPSGQHRPYLEAGTPSRVAAVKALRAARDEFRSARRA